MTPIKHHSTIRRPSKAVLTRELESIYEDETGTVPDISRLQPTARRGMMRSLLVLGSGLAVICAVAWLGWWLFQQYAPDSVKQLIGSRGDVRVTIDAPTEAKSGDSIEYVIHYQNKGSVDIERATMNVRYPAGFRVADREPAPEEGLNADDPAVARREDNWRLGLLPAGGEMTIKITGVLNAPEESAEHLWVVLTYEPANFSSTFQTEARVTTTIAAAPIAVELTGADQTATTNPYVLTIAYRNATEQDIPNVDIVAKYPTNFTAKTMEPAPVAKTKNHWHFDSLKSGESGTIVVTGLFAANATGDQPIVVTTTRTDGTTATTLSEKTKVVTLVTGEVLIELKVNGATDNAATNFGDTLSYTLSYQNNGTQSLKDLTAAVFFTSSAEVLSWSTLQDRYDGTLDEFEAGKFLQWTKREVPNLGELKPGEKGVIDFTVKLSSSAGDLSGDLNLQNVATVTIGQFGDKPSNLQLSSNQVKVLLNSNTALTAVGRYFGDDGASLGSGPIPPQVGQSTHYVIVWTVQNSVHEIRDVTVSTTLPEGVLWSGARQVAVGSIEYEPANRRVVWTINRMPTTLNLNYQASFEVSITPQSKDVGKVLALTGDQALKAVDAVTTAAINQTRGSITTDLSADPLAKGKGLVVGE